MRRPAARLFLAASAGLAVLLSACAAPAATPPSSSNGTIEVVTSTNVYGDIVRNIGGDKVSVTALITKTSQDPHSFEASAQDKLVVSKAKLLVENGGGYDGFLRKLAEGSTVGQEKIISAVEASGLAPAEEPTPSGEPSSAEAGHEGEHAGFNEHVWYNLAAMEKLTDVIASKLGALDSASASFFKTNADKFKSSLTGIAGQAAALKAANGSAAVAVTEPVPLYLLETAGLENKTPDAFSEAIEEGTDVPAQVLKETTDLLASKAVRFLAYNQQTEGPQTEVVRKAAEAAGLPVVDFTETLPEGKDYLQWMTANVENIKAALNK